MEEVWGEVDHSIRTRLLVLGSDGGRGIPVGVDIAVIGHAGVDRLRRFWAQVEGQRRLVQGVMFDFPQAEHRFPLLQGNLDTLRPALMRGDGVLISEPLARHRGLGIGDPLTLHTAQGATVLNILGVRKGEVEASEEA